jgi:hypothetical protein
MPPIDRAAAEAPSPELPHVDVFTESSPIALRAPNVNTTKPPPIPDVFECDTRPARPEPLTS